MYKRKVLCPGSGLGRLPFEIAKKGYICQGNEFSYFMLVGGNFILNRTQSIEMYSIYPYIHQVSNNLTSEHQLREIKIPDVLPSELPPNADFSYAAGDFTEIYSEQSASWDSICTCFFIDTANNVIQYIETIYKILKPGGTWINLGPLLYHYSDMPHEQSIELSLDELISVVKSTGFKIEKQEMKQSTYSNNKLSMMQVIYTNVFFVAVKP